MAAANGPAFITNESIKNSECIMEVKAKNGKTNGISKSLTNGYKKVLPKFTDKYAMKNNEKQPASKEYFEEVPLFTAVMSFIGFYFLMFLGYINQVFFTPKVAKERCREGYTPLYEKFESFYMRYVYRRVRDCWNQPICSVPGSEVILKDRITKDYGWSFEYTGTVTKCMNLGSYNYLGFAEATGPCAVASVETIKEHGLAMCSSTHELGTHPLITELEEMTARFLGVEDAIVFGMGFATNSLNLPALVSPGCLVLSDEKNHASLILGLRLSGASCKVFRHNKPAHLEKILRQAIVEGQPRTRRPWRKILIVVEGVFSMEGSIIHLPEIIRIKKQYKAYLYLDEAHSIGAMGKHGRGVIDYYNCNPQDVDVLMGTFTKSFASAGGYLAGSKRTISWIRAQSQAACYASAMSPPIVQQIITSMRTISGEDGTGEGAKRIAQLARNTRYFRQRLRQLGVVVYGNEDSPVVPMLVYMFSKTGAVVRALTDRNIATVGVGFPATPLMESRIRFCLSAAHTKQQLDYALTVIEEISVTLGLKYSKMPIDKSVIPYECEEDID